MDTIVFASHKGGCGKSILAASLAVAAQAAGERVFLLDMDPKKSLVRWSAKRKDRTLPVRTVSSAKLPSALSALGKRQVSLVILDTPFFESPASLAAMAVADLSIVPVRPGTFDLWASEMTGRKLKLLDKEFVFVLNQCSPVRQALHVQETIDGLEAVGTLLRPHIRSRTVFLEAARTGYGVTEVDPKGEAAREMHSLWLAVKRRLPLSGATQ